MNAHFSRDTFPNGGWIYFCPQTGWSAPSPKSSTFSQTVQQIIAHRKQNPAMTVRHKWSLDPGTVAMELEMFTRLRIGAPLPTPTSPSLGNYGPLSAAVSDIKKLASGAGLLVSWDASGLPAVEQEVANKRAETCSRCPLNSSAKYEQWRSVPIAASLASRLTRLEGLRLKTPSDVSLGLCESTYVPTAKLVHVPMQVISRRLKDDVRSSLAPDCWILKEG